MQECGAGIQFWSPCLPMNEDEYYEYHCILPQNHKSEEHLLKFSDKVYVVWHHQQCEDLEDGDPCLDYCECYESGEIGPDEAQKMIAAEQTREGDNIE